MSFGEAANKVGQFAQKMFASTSGVRVGVSALDNSGYTIQFLHIPSNTTVKFSGFMTSFSDKYNAQWNQEEVFGRMDPLQIYQGTKRVITIAWDVPSDGLNHAKENFENATKLIKMLYPYYQNQGGAKNTATMTSSPLFKVKFANIIANMTSPNGDSIDTSGLVGVIPTIDYTPDFNSGFFSDGKNFIYPQTIKMNAEIHVLHTHTLGWCNEDKDFRKIPFPYLAKGQGSSDKDISKAFDFGEDDEEVSYNDAKQAVAEEKMTGVA